MILGFEPCTRPVHTSRFAGPTAGYRQSGGHGLRQSRARRSLGAMPSPPRHRFVGSYSGRALDYWLVIGAERSSASSLETRHDQCWTKRIQGGRRMFRLESAAAGRSAGPSRAPRCAPEPARRLVSKRRARAAASRARRFLRPNAPLWEDGGFRPSDRIPAGPRVLARCRQAGGRVSSTSAVSPRSVAVRMAGRDHVVAGSGCSLPLRFGRGPATVATGPSPSRVCRRGIQTRRGRGRKSREPSR